MNPFLIAVSMLALSVAAFSQRGTGVTGGGVPTLSNGAPTGPCSASQIDVDTTTGILYTCNAGTWLKQVASGGAGSFTTLTASGVSTLSGTSISKVLRDARQDGVVCNGATDDSAAITLALTNAFAAGQGGIQLPSGQCKVNTTVNDTNKPDMDVSGSNSNEDYSTAIGGQNYGITPTQILCNTGATPCWDATGSGRFRLRNISFRAQTSYSAPSQIGIMLGRDNAPSNPGWTTGIGTYCFPQENKLENVWIYFDSIPAATAVGTVAVYNVGAEQFQMIGGGYIADNPVFMAATNLLGLSSPYQTLATGCPASMSEVKIGHGVVLQAWTRSTLDLRGIIDFESEADTELINGGPGTNHSAAITLNPGTGTTTNVQLKGQDEGFDYPLNINDNVRTLYAQITAVNPIAAGLILMNTGVTVQDFYFNMPQINGSVQPLFNASSGVSTLKSGLIFMSTQSGTGSCSNITITGVSIYAPGLTDANIDNCNAASTYDSFTSTGRRVKSALTVTGQLTSSVTTGTAPLVIASTTNVANLNASTLSGATFANPGTIGTTPGLGSFTALKGTTISTTTNCAVNSASPAACASAPSGVVAVPTLTTTYTVNTTAVTANSRIFLQPTSDNTGIPSSPTCATLAVTAVNMISARVAATSFTFSLPSTTGITCFEYWIVN